MLVKNMSSDFRLYKELTEKYPRIVGVDEVGRGALAGPIVVAAVEISEEIKGVNDSKLLSRLSRATIANLLKNSCLQREYGIVTNIEIDELGVSAALNLAYSRALENITADIILTDNVRLPGLPHMKSVRGDQLFYPTAAASIVAKVYRDELMHNLHQEFPVYDWINNVGYGTKHHLDAIKKNGRCAWHRRSFG